MTDEPKFKRYGGEGEPASPGEAIAAYIGIGAFAVVGCGILTVLFLFAFGWLQVLHTFAVMVLSLAAGILFFWMLSVWLYVSRRDSEAEELEQYHEKKSQAEVMERRVFLNMAFMAKTRQEEAYWMERHKALSAIHKTAWNQRVKQIVDILAPISDEEQAELDAGINPYKKPSRER